MSIERVTAAAARMPATGSGSAGGASAVAV